MAFPGSRCSKLIRFAATTAIWSSITLLTLLLFLGMLAITAVAFPFDPKRKLQHAQCFWWSDAVIRINPYWKIAIQGLEHIDRNRTYIIVANHQSIADIVMLFQTRIQFKWIAKYSLFRVPFIGWCMSLAKHVRLERSRLSSIRSIYREAEAWLDNGISMMFFPEGTRSEKGEMRNFQNGAFKLAMKKKVAVLPIAIKGTAGALPKGNWIVSPARMIGMTVLPAIETDAFQPLNVESLKNVAWEAIHHELSAAGSNMAG